MHKIPNLFFQNPIIVSQGLHNQPWNNKNYNVAIDFAYIGGLICPFDGCEIMTYPNTPQGQQSYFGLKLPDGSIIIIVHARPTKTGKINKGEVFSACTWHHYHLSIIVNGKFDCILCYMDRNIAMHTEPGGYAKIGGKNHPDGKWESYQDKYLQIGVNPKPPTPPLPTPPTFDINQEYNVDFLRAGESLSVVAQRHNVDFKTLINPATKQLFDPNSYRNLPVNQEVWIPKLKPVFTDYVVKSGDTFSGIIEKHYNLKGWENIKKKVDEIAKLNEISNPSLIRVGQTIKLN